MDLQQHYEQVHQQWLMEQQHNQQLCAQHLQQQNPNMIQPAMQRKRGLINESDEFMGIKKRNLGSEATAQGIFDFSETGADSPGSILSTDGQLTGYFDQQPCFSGSSSAATSPHLGGVAQYQQRQYQQQLSNMSAPSTPAASSGSNISGPSSLSRSPSSMSNWGPLTHGSHSSPPTPNVSSLAGVTTAMAAAMAANNLISSSLFTEEGTSFQQRQLEEQKMLQEAQNQEAQKLQMAQQWELEQMQRHQQEDQQSKARQQQQLQQMYQSSVPNASVAPVHHDHNDPATWGSYNMTAPVGQFAGYLGGQSRSYTPAAIGGVAALAAVSAMAASRHTPMNNHRGDGSSEY
ncbi:hypothetical protein FBU30_003374 [Linnemannia zychae]|nr:hypothetical protein FBU30_003374 [Linnemannia zychae]